MPASTQVLDDEGGFDRAAAQAYLRGLGGQPAPRRRSPKAVRQDQSKPAAPPHVAPLADQPPPMTISRRWIALAAALIAIAAPLSIGGAGLAYWHASKSAVVPGSQERAAQAQIEPVAEEAYIGPRPVLATHGAKLAKSVRQHGRRPHPRVTASHRPRPRHSDDDDIFVAPEIPY